MNEAHNKHTTGAEPAPFSCEDIQGVLFDYVSHELGGSRSELVHEHLRHCRGCRAAAAELRQTFEMLQSADPAPHDVPERLSDDRRARLFLALMHPVLDFVYRHHVIISVIAALAGVALALVIGYHTKLWDWTYRPPPGGVTVTIGPRPVDSNTVNRAP